MTDSFVYFLRPIGMNGPVKIGCSIEPQSRLKAYNLIAPWPLEIVATFPGDLKVERRFHAAFTESHSHHEWFKPSDEMEAMIADINAGRFTADRLSDEGCSPCWKQKNQSAVSVRSQSLGMRLYWHERRSGVVPPPNVGRAFWGRRTDEQRLEAIEVVEAYLAANPLPKSPRRSAAKVEAPPQ